MAELFLAKHVGMEGFERVVAIKRILAHLAYDEEFVNMFRDEARIVAKLSHPNIVQIFDLGKSDDSYFIAMEYIPGRNLATIAKRARSLGEGMPPLFVARCIAQACEALHYAHTREDSEGASLGIVHRDVSPQNIIVSFSGGVKLVDFGIAKAATKIAHTRAGVLKGKYAYMSPEQIRGEGIDARSDLFSAGIVLYELLTGQRPFEKDSSIQTLKAIVQDPHPDCRGINPAIPEQVAKVIDKALEKQRERRFQTAQELQLALEDAVAAGEERVNSLSIANWMARLFEAELKKSSGHTMIVKGVGEVILPPPEDLQAVDVPLDSTGGFSEEGTEEAAAKRAVAVVVAPPRSTTGAGRHHLIEEGVIAHVPSSPPGAPYLDDHTEIAPGSLGSAPQPAPDGAKVIERPVGDDPLELSEDSFSEADEETFSSREEISAVAASEPAVDSAPQPDHRSNFSDIAGRLLEVSEEDADPWGDKTSADPQSELPPPLDEPLGRPVILDEPAPDEAAFDLAELTGGLSLDEEDPWGDRTAAEPVSRTDATGDLPAVDTSHMDPTLPPSRGLNAADVLAESPTGPESVVSGPEATDGDAPLLSLAFSDEQETLSVTADPASAPALPEVDTLDPRKELELRLDRARTAKSPQLIEVEPEDDEHLETDDDLEPELPEAARAGLDRDVDMDSSTVAGMGLLDSGFPEDEQTVGVSSSPSETQTADEDPRQRLASIQLGKRSMAPSGAAEERHRPNAHIELELDEPKVPRRGGLSFESGAEELTAPADGASLSRPPAPEPRIASIAPPSLEHDPLSSLAFAELGSPADLFRPREPAEMGPPDPNAALGSTRVPAGALSLSDLLTDEKRSAYGMGLVAKPPAQGGGMVSAEPAAASSRADSSPGDDTSRGTSGVRVPPNLRLTGLRNIRETSRAGPSLPPGPASHPAAPGAVSISTPAQGVPPGSPMIMGPDGQLVPAYGSFVPQPAPFRPGSSSKTLQWVLVVLGVLVLAGVVGVGYFALRGTRLTIETVPPGARVSINGHPVDGLTPVEVRRLKPGSSYQVLIEREGYADFLGLVAFPENSREARVSFPLEKNPEEEAVKTTE